ncbi:retrovirus-related Pol polyprotein from transposon RE1 isoform X2 [Nymphaea colorata]|uniref:retrovirus-related Pol polyprotein from transposon RE1 isoform X2 n=1 Tax=Nymphaea colorata TaxID=210225 RepID=UPI00129DCC9A|nr:retrovirus-related Pol polyprotein from transposon RE1 isoform X2 [Nymphaea colorata]
MLMIFTGECEQEVAHTRKFLQQHFVTKDLGQLRYFLGIEVARSKEEVVLSQRKYVLDLLQNTRMLGAKPTTLPMNPQVHLFDDDLKEVASRAYKSLIGKLLYVTVTRPNISFAVGKLSQFMEKPRKSHWDAAMLIVKYLKSSPSKGLFFKKGISLDVKAYSDADYAGSVHDRKSTIGFCVFVGENFISWRSKKQNVVSRSSAESEYHAMAQTTAEMTWFRSLLESLGIPTSTPMKMFCDNKAVTYIANNPVFHERTKHIEVDCHYIRDMVQEGIISTIHVASEDQAADIFTKALPIAEFFRCCDKLSMINIYVPA